MNTMGVLLTSGTVVTVYPVPMKILDIVHKSCPIPSAPIKESNNTATGEPMRYIDKNDPDYLQAKEAAEEKAARLWSEAQLLFALKDVIVPEDWEPPIEDIQFVDPEWQPTPGNRGLKLDYITWELLKNSIDHRRVINALNELSSTDIEEADRIEDTFQGTMERQTS